FAKAWGFGLDGGLQIFTGKWKFGISARDVTTTFNSWSFNFTDEEKQALYLTQNDIPIKSTELTAPRLILGAARDFRINSKLSLLAEANLARKFDGKEILKITTNPLASIRSSE